MYISIKLISLAWCHKPIIWQPKIVLATLVSNKQLLKRKLCHLPLQSKSVNPSASERQKFQILELLRPTLSVPGRHGSKQKFRSPVNTKCEMLTHCLAHLLNFCCSCLHLGGLQACATCATRRTEFDAKDQLQIVVSARQACISQVVSQPPPVILIIPSLMELRVWTWE